MKSNQKNLTEPEEIFNFLGERRFGKEWSHLPLQILQRSIDKSKFSKETYRRNKYMSDRIFKEFNKILKESDVSIYATLEPYDIEVEKIEIVRWERPYFRISRDFFLIEQEIDQVHGYYDTSRRHFWIETHKKKRLWLPKKSGRKAKLDKDYLKSLLPEVVTHIPDKITSRSLEKAYKDYLNNSDKKPPSKSWINEHLDKELKKLKENQGF